MNNYFKRTIVFVTGILLLSGCATYRFQHGSPPYDKGYVASRDDKYILEYTLGKDNSVPGIKLAKERFNRRKRVVEDYYKRMGIIQNHFTMAVWEPTISFLKLVGGVFRLPFIALSDYRYDHDPKYKERIRKMEAEQDLQEAERVKKLKDKLNVYVQNDLKREEPVNVGEQKAPQEAVEAPKPAESAQVTEKPVTSLEQKPAEERTAEQMTPVKETPETYAVTQGLAETKPIEQKQEEQVEPKAQEQPKLLKYPQESEPSEAAVQESKEPEEKQSQPLGLSQDEGVKAVIIAKPVKGYSPLRVKFDGRRSSSRAGRIVSYLWDFGDGETSTKPTPINTYLSTTYGSRFFTVTLTVKDRKGHTQTSNITIEVLTK